MPTRWIPEWDPWRGLSGHPGSLPLCCPALPPPTGEAVSGTVGNPTHEQQPTSPQGTGGRTPERMGWRDPQSPRAHSRLRTHVLNSDEARGRVGRQASEGCEVGGRLRSRGSGESLDPSEPARFCRTERFCRPSAGDAAQEAWPGRWMEHPPSAASPRLSLITEPPRPAHVRSSECKVGPYTRFVLLSRSFL